MTSPEKKPNGFFQPLTKLITRWEVQLFIITLLVLFFGQFLSPHFLKLNNQFENTNNFVDIGLMALAMSFIIVTGNIDLSVASNLGMSTVSMALLFQAGVPIWIAVGIGLLVGAVGGLFNGILVGVVKLPALVATLATYSLYRGIAYTMIRDLWVGNFPDQFTAIGQQNIPGTSIPNSLILFALFVVIFYIIFHRSTLGRYLFAIGQNEDACRYSGVQVDKIKILIFTISGFMAAMAGMVIVSKFGTIRADIATGYELTVITAVVLGGILTIGGVGTLPGVIISLFLVGELRLLMNLMNVKGQIQQIAFGLLLIISILMPRVINIIRSRQRTRQIQQELQKPTQING